jgi:glutaryl-CoA dehydrogenase
MGKYGLGGLQTDGTSALFKGLMYVEVARADVSLSALVGIHNELIVGMIDELGSEEQKQRWLPGLTAFTQLGAFALTEPDHGSDIAGGLETSARLEGGEWVINGAKRWIGAGTIADFALVWARDEADRQIKGFIVETDRPGYSATKISNKIGLRIMQNADIRLDDVRIPETNMLPGATDFSKANDLLRDSRAWVGWQGAGIQLAAFDVARAYALERKQFGRELARFQLVQQQLAEILGNASASLALMAQLARIQQDGKLEMVQAAMAKSTTTRLARASVAMGRSLMGGNGISSDYEMGKLFGDAEILYTYEGSYEINSLIVARAVTGKSAFV